VASRSAQPLLLIEGLTAGYGKLEILHDVHLEFQPGELTCLLGPNGAGKSTLLRTLFGLTTYMSGGMAMNGSTLVGRSQRELLKLGLAYVPQGRCNFPLMTVTENLQMSAYGRKVHKDAAALERSFDLFPALKERRSQLAGNLSGGEQQMLELAMAVLHEPKLLLVDEPSIGLAPRAIGWVFDELVRLHAEGLTILLVEQNTRKAIQVTMRTVVLRLGRVAWDAPSNSLTLDDLGEIFMTGRLATASEKEPR
jgi:branched-chain amino acid transport system ATP-binding protein